MSSAIVVKEIVYHCQCNRFTVGTPVASHICHACGREHILGSEYQMRSGPGYMRDAGDADLD